MVRKIQILITAFLFSIVANAQNTIEIDCQELFLSGTNLAWNQFGGDVGFGSNPDLTYFNNFFKDVHDAGGNSVRWWFHTDATFTPQIETSGNVTGLHHNLSNAEIIAQVEGILDAAWANEIHLTISLFSFDMLQDATNKVGWSNINFEGNKAFLQSKDNVQSYIDNGLTEMVTALKDHPALMSWEIFNEPEGMASELGWTGNNGGVFVSMSDIQMVVNKITGAIHDADPEALVTNGTWALRANSDKGSNFNYYRDDRLIAAGGAANGTLDFYQVHFYDWQNSSISPFAHPASYWELDKPLMIGEFHADEAAEALGVTDNSVYEWLYDNGYFGAWGWQYNESNLWNETKKQVAYMQAAHPDIVNLNLDACLSAEFTVDKTEICENQSIVFTSKSSASITSWTWDFGNGETSIEQGPHTITYDTAGDYTVSLTTSDGVNEDVVTKIDYISVAQETLGTITIVDGSSCDTSITFNANLAPAIENASYRWYVNGTFIESTNATFETSILNEGDKVHFEISSGSLVCYNFNFISEELTVECSTLNVDNYLIEKLVMYPNPATNKIDIKGLDQEATIQIYSVLGKRLIHTNLVDKSIDISHLSKGIYFVEISTEKASVTKRLIKE